MRRVNPLLGLAHGRLTFLTAPPGVLMRGTLARNVVLCSKKWRCCQVRWTVS